ncbi:MAG: hypothetical protein OEZ06_27850 [Myxococcales bacterium]|nr:hypothetical protein [Myxococcales bacterium]
MRHARRRQAIEQAIVTHLGETETLTGRHIGLHALLWLERLNSSELPLLRRLAADRGVGVYPVTPFYVRPPQRAGLLLGYSSSNEAQIDAGIEGLADALRQLERQRGD